MAITCLATGTLAFAQPIPPTSGQILRDVQQDGMRPAAPATTAPIRINPPAPSPQNAGSNVEISVLGLRIEGNTVVSKAELSELLSDLPGGQHTLAELERAVDRVTALYLRRGYILVRAYIPAQEMKDGILLIRVREGKLDEIDLENRTRVGDERAQEILSVLHGDGPINGHQLERVLMLLRESAGVANVRGTLRPGHASGTTDLLVEMEPGPMAQGRVELDNYGNYYTGTARLGGLLQINSPLRRGDMLRLRGYYAGEGLLYGRADYIWPVGRHGSAVGVGVTRSSYALGQGFASLGAHGDANGYGLIATHPFVLDPSSRLIGTITAEKKSLVDLTNSPASLSNQEIKIVFLGLSGDREDSFGGIGVVSFDVNLGLGQLALDPVTAATDAASARTAGHFGKVSYVINRLQRLSGQDTLLLNLSGQFAQKNLHSAERFSLGGPYSVRAYPQSEVSGDQGWLVNLEWRRRLSSSLQVVGFVDGGSVRFRAQPFAAGANSRSLSGVGAGLNTTLAGLQVDAYLAWRLGGGTPVSEPATQGAGPRLWVRATKNF